MKPCPLPLVALAAHETCPRCGRPAREHRGHPAYVEPTTIIGVDLATEPDRTVTTVLRLCFRCSGHIWNTCPVGVVVCDDCIRGLEEKTMTETTEPTREQIIEVIDGLVHDTDAPQWMKDLEDDGTQAEWFTAVLRLALRTLDAEEDLDRARKLHASFPGSPLASEVIDGQARRLDEMASQLAAMTERSERAESALRDLKPWHDQVMARHAEIRDVEAQIAAMTERAEKAERERESNAQRCLDAFDDIARALHERNAERERAEKAERERDDAVRQAGVECAAKHELRAKLADAERRIAEVERERDFYRTRKDEAYTERNRVVALLARLVLANGGMAGKRKHEPDPDPTWDPEWLTLVAIDLPTGQVSWHFHDSDAHLVADLPEYRGSWDGHDTPEKYRRVTACTSLPDACLADAERRIAEVERDRNYALKSVRIGNNTICKVADILECATGERVQDAARRVSRERDEERHLATVRGEMLSAYERRITELSAHRNVIANRVFWIDHVTGERCEHITKAPFEDIVHMEAIATAFRMMAFDTLRAKLTDAERRIAELSPPTVPTTDERLDCEASSLLLLSTWARRVMMRPKNRDKGLPEESVEELIVMAQKELDEARDAIEENAPTDDILAELGDAAAYIAFAMREVESRRNR